MNCDYKMRVCYKPGYRLSLHALLDSDWYSLLNSVVLYENLYEKVDDCYYRIEKKATVLDHMLAALNTFCQSVAISARTRLCLLGENLFSDMLAIWKNSQPHVKVTILFLWHSADLLHDSFYLGTCRSVSSVSVGGASSLWGGDRDWWSASSWLASMESVSTLWSPNVCFDIVSVLLLAQRNVQQLYDVILSDLERVWKDMSWKAPGLAAGLAVIIILHGIWCLTWRVHRRGVTEQRKGFVKLAVAVFHQVWLSKVNLVWMLCYCCLL